jgi:hypothetical protein
MELLAFIGSFYKSGIQGYLEPGHGGKTAPEG